MVTMSEISFVGGPLKMKVIVGIMFSIFSKSLVIGVTSEMQSCASSLSSFGQPPNVEPRVFYGGRVLSIQEWAESQSQEISLLPILGCCSKNPIGSLPQMSTEEAIEILSNAKKGWNSGSGTWPQMTLRQRIDAIQKFTISLEKSRDEIIKVLMYEIGKNYVDAASEFDRTIDFIRETISTVERIPDFDNNFEKISSSNVMIRRNGFGIILVLGPYNYPLNETYATLIPALLSGNVVILKIPQVGGLVHLLTFKAFSEALPPDAMNFISGGGRVTLPKLMESGDIDGLAFIGGTNAADKLIKQHPRPHRLKLFLQLEAKNMAIVMDDMINEIEGAYSAKTMFDEIIRGALSYNGQRCTALKIVFVPKGSGKLVAEELAKRVEALAKGMPWERHGNDEIYSMITPLPNESRINYMNILMQDALQKGAIANENGGIVLNEWHQTCSSDGNENSLTSMTLMYPAILYNVTSEMKIFTEEQFGPIVPVVEYDSIDDVLNYGLYGEYGQQVSIFTNKASKSAVSIIDKFSAIFGKININSQCGRSPDTVPFTARRSSGMGVMSIENALKEFSIPTVLSFKHEESKPLVEVMKQRSAFMSVL